MRARNTILNVGYNQFTVFYLCLYVRKVSLIKHDPLKWKWV